MGCRVLVAILMVAALGFVCAANYALLASQSGGMTRKDFMSLWTGGKAIALGLDPYDVAVWRPLRASYGDTWLPDPICPFPAWTILFFVPLSFLTPQMAGALWMTVCEAALLAGVAMTAQALRWCAYQKYLPWILIGLALFRPIFTAIANGQLSPVLFFLLAAALYLHRQGHAFSAGVLLALQATKPNLTMFFLPFAGLIFLVRRDWRTLGGLVVGGLGLLAASWVVLPGWPFQWLAAAEKARATGGTPSLWGLAHDWVGEPHWAIFAGGGTSLVCLGLVALVWKQRSDDWLFNLASAVCVSTFVTPYLWAYEQLILFFPALVGLYWAVSSASRWPWSWVGGWLLVVVGLSWTLVYVAMSRGVDTWSAFVTLGVMGYLALAWRAHRRAQPMIEEGAL